ncbi:RNA polymerase sigma factor [Virgisporangium aurantiacum]|uniref:RNA polymerase sigma24 factor n=1 Tax=Virgisporangium aurantiacum TaxID=175570 RepID=A0A8J3ZE72_9ACTN|nr:RNA polymerase sigma24 factor [Virgisporangium aurantiacum]
MQEAGAAGPAPGHARSQPLRPGGPVTSRDRAGFDEFYQMWYSRLVAQVHAYLGNRSEAEDVVQEAFLRAWQRWPQVSQFDDAVAWVRRVAWNLATSTLRRLSVAVRALRRQSVTVTQPGLNPDHVALVAALRRLPERQRLVIVLHHLGDIPTAEIATDLGVPKGTVVSWLHRGRAQLATHLTDAGEPSTPPGPAPRTEGR